CTRDAFGGGFDYW
nr:immunoglobulin heavy chain junction region [Macaca mulatta]MOV56435.1 immunoglobulin heavy chain junction region [Macaca mulatta]MOV56516.1 immunoglobulin heavy chain junction region [Macaca mulatta]MOV56531.1 immunoglobulin heavy chain junction region [Macaca mulatta]MOV59249.1 immunoglobulin heavy chain junction region [Macaca mulatta]